MAAVTTEGLESASKGAEASAPAAPQLVMVLPAAARMLTAPDVLEKLYNAPMGRC